MGGYDSAYESYMRFPDSEDEDETMTPRPASRNDNSAADVKGNHPLSPPNSEPLDEEAVDEDDDLYGTSSEQPWNKSRRDSSSSASLDGPINPQWLLSNDSPGRSSLLGPDSQAQGHHPSPPSSEDSKTPKDRSGSLETIPEGKGHLIKSGPPVKSSKSFPLLPELLNLKQAEDEDEKMLASDEGRRLNPKERRQLRNKVSARNFRVRRKEYIGHLEHLVETQSQEIETLRQSLSALQMENNQLRQESGFLRSMAMPHQQPPAPAPPPEPVMPSPHTKDVNPNAFEWPLAYDGMSSPTQSSNKFTNRPMFGQQIHAYEARVPEVTFDKPHLNNPAPPLPTLPAPQQPQQQPYPPNSPRPSQDSTKQPAVGVETYPGMLQAVTYLYDYIVKASTPGIQGPPPQQQQGPLPAPSVYPLHPATPYNAQPQQWPEAKLIGAPTLGFNPHYNSSWGWGGPPGPAV